MTSNNVLEWSSLEIASTLTGFRCRRRTEMGGVGTSGGRMELIHLQLLYKIISCRMSHWEIPFIAMFHEDRCMKLKITDIKLGALQSHSSFICLFFILNQVRLKQALQQINFWGSSKEPKCLMWSWWEIDGERVTQENSLLPATLKESSVRS